MRISVITPTAGRPLGMTMCEKYIARQTVQPDEWIVADGGEVPDPLTMGQKRIWNPSAPGYMNFAINVLNALDAVTGTMVIVIENDDWYAPDHIEQCIKGLATQSAYGCPTLRYFNVAHRCYVEMMNRGSALCQTAFRRELIPAMRQAAEQSMAARDFTIDGRFWAPRQRLATGPQTVIGIKGLPGTAGLGIGHRPKSSRGKLWRADPELSMLRKWIGDDADAYVDLA